MSTSNKGPGVDPRLQNLTNSLYLDSNDDVVVRTGFAGDIIISGTVNIPGVVEVTSNHDNPLHTHVENEAGTSLAINDNGGSITVDGTFWQATQPVSIAAMPNIAGAVSITGTPTVNIAATGNQGKLWTVQVAQGLVANTTNVQITGYNPSTSVGDAIWSAGTAYPWSSLVTAQTLYLKSSTNNATDRGMSILISGLDSNYAEQTEIITLNASNSTTAVSTTKQFLRIHYVMCNGSDTNVGDITTTVTSGSGVIVNKISAGRGIAKAGSYTVPAGYTGYLWKGDASSTGATVVNFMARYFGKAFMVSHVAVVDNSTYVYDFPFPLPIPEKTDVYCQVEAGSGKTAINYEILLVKNP